MAYLISAINPILYNLTSSRFRTSLTRMIKGTKRQKSISRTSSYRPCTATAIGNTSIVSTSPLTLRRSCSVSLNHNNLIGSPRFRLPNSSYDSKLYGSTLTVEQPILNTNLSSSTSLCSSNDSPYHQRAESPSPHVKRKVNFTNSASFNIGKRSPKSKDKLNQKQKSPFLGRSTSLATTTFLVNLSYYERRCYSSNSYRTRNEMLNKVGIDRYSRNNIRSLNKSNCISMYSETQTVMTHKTDFEIDESFV